MDHNAKAPGRPGFAPSTSPVYSIQREGGSVRRARERVEAGLVSQEARSGLDGGNRNLGYPDNLQGSQDSQWPLVSHGDSTRKRNNSPTGNRPHGQGRAPQRPPRPVYVPGILDASHEPDGSSNFPPQQPLDHFQRPQDHQPANSWDPSYSSTRREPGTPGTTGTGFSATSGSLSRPSTSSSVGTIPEFPVPVVPFSATPQQTRRGANLGPPPSSRRGASSYYSQSSYVTPIMEEQYEPGIHSHGSFASSHVIPASWGDESLGSFAPAEENLAGTTEKGPDLRSTGHDDSSDLAHSASSGKPHKPSLATLRSTDNAEESDTTGVGGGSVAASEKPPRFSRAAGETGGPVAAALGTTKDDPMGLDSDGGTGRTAFLDTPSSSNSSINKNFDNLTAESVAAHAEAKDKSSPEDPRVRQILGGLEKGGAIKAGTPLPLTTSPTDQSGKVLKRPNRLNVDAARETDSRGSLTSLPDLIRRATKLASNLDRGRTASRLGMLEILGGSDSEKNNSPCRCCPEFHVVVVLMCSPSKSQSSIRLDIGYACLLSSPRSRHTNARTQWRSLAITSRPVQFARHSVNATCHLQTRRSRTETRPQVLRHASLGLCTSPHPPRTSDHRCHRHSCRPHRPSSPKRSQCGRGSSRRSVPLSDHLHLCQRRHQHSRRRCLPLRMC